MNILQILPGKVWGGAEQYVLDLGRRQQTLGHDVSYICLPSEPVTSRLDAEGVKYTELTSRGLLGRRFDHDTLRQALATADTVHLHDAKFLSAVLSAAPAGTNVVLTRHIARPSRVLPWKRRLYRRLHTMIFVSRFSMDAWTGANPWMPQEKCRMIHNSVPPTAPSDPTLVPLREKFHIPPSVPLLVFTGRVRRSKGAETIIDALALLPPSLPWAMVFIGAGKPHSYIHTLRERAAIAGLAHRVHFYGPSRSVRPLIADAQIGIQPSIVREAFGLSQIEFMQAAVPVITTDNGAQPEYITPSSGGILIPPDSPAELAHAIGELLADPSRATDMGECGRRYYTENLSYDRFVNQILDTYT